MLQSTRPRSSETRAAVQEMATRQVSASPLNISDFLRALFRLLDENEVCYCILHSWQDLPESLTSDLDIAIDPKDRGRLRYVLRGLIDKGYRAIQYRWHRQGHRYDFAWFESDGMRSAGVDYVHDYVENGLVLIPSEELLSNRRNVNGFWVASPVVEFAYVLAKKTVKGCVPERQADRLRVLADEIGGPEARRISAMLFGAEWKEQVADACLIGTIGDLLPQLRRQLWLTRFKKAPLGPFLYLITDIPRLICRVIRPTGVFIVVLGPDGAGKSTLVGHMAESIERAAFNRFRIFHWRPNVILPQSDTGVPTTDPHDEPPRGTLGSIAALLIILLDYIVGYIFTLRPFLTRAGLVIFDRYYHDVLVDPLRYRYGGPLWLARIVGHFVPPPDLLFLVLDADVGVILARKKELPMEEVQRQRESYQLFSKGDAPSTLIRTDLGVDKTVEEASRFVIEYLAQRFQRRNRA